MKTKDKFKLQIIELLIDEAGTDIDDSMIEIPPAPEIGDYAFPCFVLSKQLKKKPQQISDFMAGKLKEKIKEPMFKEYITDVKNNGPYLNFFINKTKLAELTLNKVITEKDNYGLVHGNGEKVMVEFSSPNTNKPLHLGHIRNIVLGESISRILTLNGNQVVRTCLVNDRGIHICKSMLAYKMFGNNTTPCSEKIKGDFFVGKYYVLFSDKAKEDSELNDKAQELLQKWENGDKETIELWKKMNSWVYEGFEETYKKLNTHFDRYYYESEMYDKGKELILDGVRKGIFKQEKDNSINVELEQYKIPNKTLVRSDGTTIYITQDIYLAVKKFKDYDIKKSIYVVGSEQNLHFKQLFKMLELMGYGWAKECHHLSYGMVYLPEGRMKSREGKVVDADDIIREMKEIARYEIKLRHKDLTEAELKKRSNMVGLAAIRFFMLKIEPAKDITYNPEESISFEGETGPYVQYTHARICSILKKYEEVIGKIEDSNFKNIKFNLLSTPEEANMIKSIISLPEIISEAAKHLKPSLITRYLLDLSQSFNEFYHKSKVVDNENIELTKARIQLCKAVKQVIKTGLYILGIDAPEEM